MGIMIGKFEFAGPFENTADLQEKQGLFAVLHFDGDQYELVHMSESDNIKERIEISQAAYTSSTGSVLFAACYTERCSARERRIMVDEINCEFDDDRIDREYVKELSELAAS